MELLVIVLVLLAVNGALLLGWGADSREPGYSWDPAGHRRRAAAGQVSAVSTASAQPSPSGSAATRTS